MNQSIIKTQVTCGIWYSYLTGVTAAQLQWHLSNMKWFKEYNWYFYKTKISLIEKLACGSWLKHALSWLTCCHDIKEPFSMHMLVIWSSQYTALWWTLLEKFCYCVSRVFLYAMCSGFTNKTEPHDKEVWKMQNRNYVSKVPIVQLPVVKQHKAYSFTSSPIRIILSLYCNGFSCAVAESLFSPRRSQPGPIVFSGQGQSQGQSQVRISKLHGKPFHIFFMDEFFLSFWDNFLWNFLFGVQ